MLHFIILLSVIMLNFVAEALQMALVITSAVALVIALSVDQA